MEALGRRAQWAGCLEEGKQMEAVAESFRRRQQYVQRQRGRKNCVVSGEQLMIHLNNSEHRTQKVKYS